MFVPQLRILFLPLIAFLLVACNNSDNEKGDGSKQQVIYTVTANAGEGGTISPDSRDVESGASTTFTVTADTRYEIESVVGCDGSLNGNIFTIGEVTGNCSVEASFSVLQIEIATAVIGPGSISPTSLTVDSGSAASFTLASEENGRLVSVSGCNGNLTSDTYEITDVTAACKVSAEFESTEIGETQQAKILDGIPASFDSSSLGFVGWESQHAPPPIPNSRSANDEIFIATVNHSEVGGLVRLELAYDLPLPDSLEIWSYSEVSESTSLFGLFRNEVTAAQWFSLQPHQFTRSDDGLSVLIEIEDGGFGDLTGEANGEISLLLVPATERLFQVTSSAGDGGAISPQVVTVAYGDTTNFTLTEDSGYKINEVAGCGGSLLGNTFTTAEITDSCHVSASFAINSYTVTASAGEGGDISPTSTDVNHGNTATFSVAPYLGYSIDDVTGCSGSLEGDIYTTGAITGACSVEASFSLNSYTISTQVSGSGEVSPGSTEVDHGGIASFTLTPNAGYNVANASGCQGTLNGNIFTTGPVTAGCVVSVEFALNTYMITASAGEGGSITPSSTMANHGETISFNLAPDTGYSITNVSGCDGTLAGNTYTTAEVTAACSIEASFNLNSYTVTATAGEGGNVSPATQIVEYGNVAEIAVTANSGFSVVNVSGCGGSLVQSTYTTEIITESCAVEATFRALLEAPSNVSVMSGNAQLGVAWEPVEKAEGYHIYYATVTGVDPDNYAAYENGTWVQNVSSPYELTELENATTYYLVVTAFSGNSESAPSAEVSGTTEAQVSMPQGILNDTGSLDCATLNSNRRECPAAGFEHQDGDYGRDALAREGLLAKVGAGSAGFDFTKIHHDGSVLPDDYHEWSCVRDNHTGLMWEVKTTDDGLQDHWNSYTWYNPDSSVNGGDPGMQNGGSCTGSSCDTQGYVDAINEMALCGKTDWRMPTRTELGNIVHNGLSFSYIDRDYFPNTRNVIYFTGTAGSSERNAWVVSFQWGFISPSSKTSARPVRLVRDVED